MQVAPRPVRGSYEEFLRQYGTTQVRGSTPRPVPTSFVPQIDPKAMVDELLGHGGPAAVPRDGESAVGDEAAAYFGRLVEALRAAFDVPGTLDALYAAKVSFVLTGEGLLTNVQLVRSSEMRITTTLCWPPFGACARWGPPRRGTPDDARSTFG
jgi:hypothetical protein